MEKKSMLGFPRKWDGKKLCLLENSTPYIPSFLKHFILVSFLQFSEQGTPELTHFRIGRVGRFFV